jgi:NAD(P)-dependent dehydrogenase (short-subunit alcohol dehydrogenase family)
LAVDGDRIVLADLSAPIELPDASLMIDCTGALHDDEFRPEKSWKHLSAEQFARQFAINATGPALLMKHFLPKLPRDEPSVFATLSARVGSIGDNGFGGWYSYRASKAALNQIVRTAAIELQRKWKQAALVAIHPGTVDTALSAPFAKQGLTVRPPEEAARDILAVLEGLDASENGSFIAYDGERLPW